MPEFCLCFRPFDILNKSIPETIEIEASMVNTQKITPSAEEASVLSNPLKLGDAINNHNQSNIVATMAAAPQILIFNLAPFVN